jgi:hypothetical protein
LRRGETSFSLTAQKWISFLRRKIMDESKFTHLSEQEMLEALQLVYYNFSYTFDRKIYERIYALLTEMIRTMESEFEIEYPIEYLEAKYRMSWGEPLEFDF